MLLALACLSYGSGVAAAGEPAPAPITIGETHELAYTPDDLRQINVYLPDGYRTGTQRYPVLYVIDGGLSQDFLHIAGTSALNSMWGRSQPVIVVGVETKDRRAELIGSPGNVDQRKRYPTAGHSAQFRAFLHDKVKPLIEANYRINGDDGLIGESLAGLFIVETWLRQPFLFDRYAAIDPSLWWEDAALAKEAQSLPQPRGPRGPLFLAYGNEGPEVAAAAVQATRVSGVVCLDSHPDLTHATAYHALSPEALQFLFPTDNKHDPDAGFEVTCSRKS